MYQTIYASHLSTDNLFDPLSKMKYINAYFTVLVQVYLSVNDSWLHIDMYVHNSQAEQPSYLQFRVSVLALSWRCSTWRLEVRNINIFIFNTNIYHFPARLRVLRPGDGGDEL